MSGPAHISVLKAEVVAALAPRSGGLYVDATCGFGGHTEAILEACGPNGRVLAIDQDPTALAAARARLLPAFEGRVVFAEGNFEKLESLCGAHGFLPADGVLADLGVSSMQLDRPERGFSFNGDGPLDMRMGPGVGRTAAEYLDTVEADELAEVFRTYGEMPGSRRMARRILEARRAGRLDSTKALADLVQRYEPRKGRTHPATRVFQAIRIAVNRELEVLDNFLETLPSVLIPGGLALVISFHSLEDRRVKRAFRDPPPPPLPPGLAVLVDPPKGPFEGLTRRPIVASPIELDENPRARSAKLRVARLRPARGPVDGG